MADKILIVDDDLDTLRLVGLMLQRQGYQISAATNGQQGLEKAFTEDPDLILLDVMMPDIDGYEVTRRLRQNPATAETPILMFTAKSQLDDKVIGFEAGVNDYLTKPTHPAELQARVKTLLARAGEKKKKAAVEIAEAEEGRGYVIGVLGARGGLGITTLAVNLAAGLLTRTKSEVIVAEMLPGQGSLALELGITATKGLVDLLSLSRVSDITRDKIREMLIHHGSGLDLLLASDRPRDMHLISQVANYEALVAGLSGLARFVTLDLGVGLQPFAAKTLPKCNEILILLEGVPNTIIHTKALIEDIASLGVNKRNINVVLNNRIRSDTQLPSSIVQNKLGYEITATLTPAPEVFTQATRLQAPAVLCQPESLTARQIGKLVDFIVEREALPR
ncbi:MAG: response regulator [Chloroflexota bacterium]|nr:response regulator [Chloroflexota bacterium]MBI5702338.1 response regulator [Chloroflexota bacterium]